jgi:hypothetical protein
MRFPRGIKREDAPKTPAGSLGVSGAILFFLIFFLPACFRGPGLFAQEQQTAMPSWSVPGDRIDEIEGRGLYIRTNPMGAKVYIDGLERGLTPLSLEGLWPGEYTVRIEKEGYRDRRFKVWLRSESRLFLALELEEARGQVVLRIGRKEGSPGAELLPLNPRVSVDNMNAPSPGVPDTISRGGSWTGVVLTLPVGWRTIRVRAFGWEDASALVYVGENSLQYQDMYLTPGVFRVSGPSLRRARFNPANSGVLGNAELSFEVSGPGRGRIIIKDEEGREVYAGDLGPFTTWGQQFLWNGRDRQGQILPDGSYTFTLYMEALPPLAPGGETFTLGAEIDSTRNIRPLSLASGKPGLLFAPLPQRLPPGALQIEGSLLFGAPPYSGAYRQGSSGGSDAWASLPFALAFRVSPLERLELSAALNVIPRFDESARYGFAGSAKWVFLGPGDWAPPFNLSLGLSGGWVEERTASPFGLSSGLEIFLPLSWNITPALTLAFTPSGLWTGNRGFPWEAFPRLLLAGGVLFEHGFITLGFSVQEELNFSDLAPSLKMAGELKLFPPPSRFVFSLLGGAAREDGPWGGFGGLGIGILF